MDRRKDKKKNHLILGVAARALMLVAAGILVICYISAFFNPEEAWFMTMFGLVFIPMLLLNFFLFCWCIARKSKAIVIPLLALLPSIFLIGNYFQFSSPDKDREVEGTKVKIVSYNVGRFRLSRAKMSQSDCADSVASFLKSQDADIICLQEFAARNLDALKSYLDTNFPKYNKEYFVFTNDSGVYGNVTLSKFPIEEKGKINFEKSTNLALYSTFTIDSSFVRVYNCHFESYNVSIPKFVNSIRGNDTDEFIKTEMKMKTSITRRPQQVDQVISDIEESPYRSIVLGDFNDNPISYTCYKLGQGRKDTFVNAGKGFGSTYSFLWPLIRIDYIFYPRQYEAVTHKVIRKRFSDHFPIAAEISIKNEH